ncbi:MAG TPA: enoyl-CoA hydratase-related protein [Candidatus Binataceae bacterium]|nr:enoyl-CoA hydratase-related protein [Candidatus Binataceae bacterium]
MFSNLILEVKNGVAHLTLNRPEAANGINKEMAEDLDNAARRCDDDPAVRAVLISGTGRFFCAGGDLKAFAARAGTDLPSYLEEVTAHLHHAVSLFARMRSPVIAAVHGSAAGAGFSLACAVDFVIAAESAKFTMAYTKAGLTPDGSSTFYLPRIVGQRRAIELAILNPVLDAQQALDLGIATRVVPDADLMTAATAFAEELAAGPTMAYRGVKRLMMNSAVSSLEEQMGRETETICGVASGRDAREGIAAFVAKRRPSFTGE